MGHKAFDLQGKTFGRLTVIGRDWSAAKQATWLCRCECGKEVSIWSGSLRTGNTRSCGCLRSERTTECKTKHGKHGTHEYNIWKSMNQRCTDVGHQAYHLYGGRGIAVCDEWKHDFARFISDMGDRPSKSHSIDRIDNNEGYSKDNCRWATLIQQARNRTNNVIIELNEESKTISEWSVITGIKLGTLCWRFHAGWSPKDILTKPVRDWGR